MRVKAWEATLSGNADAYKAFEASQCAQADQAMKNVLQNIPGALQASTTASPNVGMMGNSPAPQSAFGTLATAPTSVFGATPSRPVFGQTGFGASTTTIPASSPFGVGGIKPGGGFAQFATSSGQSSVFGSGGAAQAQSAFGSMANSNQPPATPGATSVFGTPSTFGARPTLVFGQSGFANVPPAPGAPAPAPASGTFPQIGFGSMANSNQLPATPGATSVFGTPSTFGTRPMSSPFGPQASSQPAFGQASQLVSPFGQQQQPAAPVSAFAQTAQPQPTSVFAQVATTQPTSVFAQAATTQPTSAFTQAAPAPAATSVFGRQATNPPSVFGGSGFSQPPKDPFAPLLPPNYLEILPQTVREAFGKDEFEWGNIPEWIPPVESR